MRNYGCCNNRRQMRAWLGRGFLLIVVGLALGCSSGPMTLVGYRVPQRQQVAITIDISKQVDKEDDGGGVSTLAETITDGLKEHGIDSQLYTSKYDHPKPPRIDIFVSYYHGTPKATHWAGVFAGDPFSKMVVDCTVTLPGQDKPVFARHFEHTSMAVALRENDDNAAAESVGEQIVDAVLKR